MILGIPKQLKDNENRIGMIPAGVRTLTASGHTVLVETGAGLGGGYTDADYEAAGAKIVAGPEQSIGGVDMVLNVKEILPQQYQYLKEGQIVCGGLHGAANPDEVEEFLKKNITAIAWEDVTDRNGGFPCMRPSSRVAGKGAFFMAAHYMNSVNGGAGLLMANVPGVPAPHVTVIGAGNVGYGAAESAVALGNEVTVLDVNLDALNNVRNTLPGYVETLYCDTTNLEHCLQKTDLLINCVLWDKSRNDHLITREMLRKYAKKSLFIADVACDVNGSLETCTHSTTHSDPIYYEEGIAHYTVDNIPAAYGRTSAILFATPMVPFIKEMADKGVVQALKDNKFLRTGLSTYQGKVTLKEICVKQKRTYVSPEEALGML